MMSLPNILTLSRIVAIPLLAFLLWWPGWEAGYLAAFVLYCAMGITDYFDGYLARSSGAVSKLGIFLDPIADKIMVAAVILVLGAMGVREFLGPLQVSVPVSRLAKWKTTFQMVALGALILGQGLPGWLIAVGDYTINLPHTVGLTTLWAAAILTVVTGWDYLRVGLRHMD